MSRIFKLILMSFGWLCLCLLFISGCYFNSDSDFENRYAFRPITWNDHIELFNGAIQCNLIEEDLQNRKKEVKREIFSKVHRKEESENGFTYYFEEDEALLASVLEHVQIEKACCPFFKFDISILPYNRGFAFQISGPKAALSMIEEFEESEL